MSNNPFKRIAIIGAGTMGSGIAGQIANAGFRVLLLDLPGEDKANATAQNAIERLLKSDPPALMSRQRSEYIEAGNTRDDFARLAECDWIIEAVVERLDIKRDLYQRLNEVISKDCIVTSNTSTIPIRLLVEQMPVSFRRRFAITHYFNPVRYMRLLELVRGEETDPGILARLSEYNDKFLGKGVVICRDTPGFLGNRVGVYALQVGMDEAFRQGLSIEQADALMGRPMGIPKTGVFGLYDLIGIDLMSDVVDTLGAILPADDAFHAVGRETNPARELIAQMVAEGYTGDKGKGGFYRVDENGAELAVELGNGDVRPVSKTLPSKALRAAENQAVGKEVLLDLIHKPAGEGEARQVQYCRNVLARVLAYAASLIPEVTGSPQDIDDAMKLGFNWVRGPFELIDALGINTLVEMIVEAGEPVPAILQNGRFGPFYACHENRLQVRNFVAESSPEGQLAPVVLAEGVVRFNMMRRCLSPIKRNNAASLYVLEGDLRLLEFHSKANALTHESMQIVAAAASDCGRGIIIHNDAQHFSAGVDLNGVLELIEQQDWAGIDHFLGYFQQAVKALKYTPVPVIGAPSGLAIGGGFEVLVHADKVIAHTNSVLGLVEAGVGLVPGGGGVKETFNRWFENTGDARKAAWNTWMQIGYSRIGNSPEQSARLMYFVDSRDESVMNRDRLVSAATSAIEQMHTQGYQAPTESNFTLPGRSLLDEMSAFMDKGINDGLFFPHDKTVAMAVAEIVVNTERDEPLQVSEDQMFAREREAFIHLAKTPQTRERISVLLQTGTAPRN